LPNELSEVPTSLLTLTRGVSQSVALPFYIKKYLKKKAKEELWKIL
jgi:hypothetical protein